jgi:hypothetical protein
MRARRASIDRGTVIVIALSPPFIVESLLAGAVGFQYRANP